MESYHAHQIILPTDKRNPCFTLYATEDGQSIRIFYGLELIEVVPDDPDEMAYKMLAGRLYSIPQENDFKYFNKHFGINHGCSPA